MALTIGGLLTDARNTLNDVVSTSGVLRYSDTELVNSFNDALLIVRAKRPDAFLAIGMQAAIPQYAMPNDTNTAFPLDQIFYLPIKNYVIARSEMKEDTFTDDSRAQTLMQMFIGELIALPS